MIRLLGTPKVLCNGITRRDMLHVGGLSMLGLSYEQALRLQAAQEATAAAPQFGKAKSCILIHLFGAPPQHETFDPKPEAPKEIQGDLGAISTSVPDYFIGEGFPNTARIADRLTFVRSTTHEWPFHAVTYAVSGIPVISPTVEADPNDRTLWPFLGSVVDYLAQQQSSARPEVPRNIALPFPVYRHANFRLLGGPYAGFLGQQYDPLWTEFSTPGTHKVPTLSEAQEVFDPYAGIKPEDRFELGGAAAKSGSDILQRLGLRRSLLEQFDQTRRDLDRSQRVQNYDRYQQSAYEVLTSSKLSEALDIGREPEAVRNAYGMNLFGQSLLASRRLIEAGGKFVTVIWDAYGHASAGWDTHSRHYPRLKEFLMPNFDHSFPAFILDLEQRGLLDETLVLCLSEHGRTPKLNNSRDGGRDHWSGTYCSLLAGGGMGKGNVVGKSDRIGGEVASNPISPKDILASAFHLLGIDPHTTVPDQLQRPVPVAGAGVIRHELFG
ncbi:MAG: DUF1501 domain-containing protein [Planctomycetaceae bacterium]